MRVPVAALLLASVLLAACAGPAAEAPAVPEGEREGEGRTSRRGGEADADENRTEQMLGSARGGPVGAGRYPFQVEAPEGGAVEVMWRLAGVPALTLSDTVEGHGCEWHSWYLLNGELHGGCADLPEGAAELAVVLNEPVAEYRVEVLGRVWPADAAGDTGR